MRTKSDQHFRSSFKTSGQLIKKMCIMTTSSPNNYITALIKVLYKKKLPKLAQKIYLMTRAHLSLRKKKLFNLIQTTSLFG